jgi:SAM-dependent methyltransferase
VTEDEIHKMAALESSHWFFVGMREITFSLLAPYVDGRTRLRILDVGCGTGGNLLELTRFGSARGVDASPVCVRYCHEKGLDVTLGSMSALPAGPESADVLTMFDVLNQADPSDAQAILAGAAAVLAPGGLFVFREPAMPIAAGAHDRATNVRYRLTRAQAESLLKGAGFEPLRLTYVNALLFGPIVLTRRIQELLRPGHAESDVHPAAAPLNALLLSVLRLEKRFLRRVNLPFGVSLFGIARKRYD